MPGNQNVDYMRWVSNHKRRVVVTGLGVVSSAGIGREEFWESVTAGRSGISSVSSFDTGQHRCHRAGEVRNFEPRDFVDRRRLPYLGRTSQLAIAATAMALEDAGFEGIRGSRERSGIFMGTTMGEKPLEETIDTWVLAGTSNINPAKVLQSSANNIPANIWQHFTRGGPN